MIVTFVEYTMKQNTVEYWRDEISDGLKFRRTFGMEEEWRSMESIFFSALDAQSRSNPNLIFSTGDALISALSIPNPRVMIKPRRPECVETAPILESVDNSLLSELGYQEVLEDAIVGSFLFGVGFIKIGFDSEYGYDPSHDIQGVGTTGMTLTQYSTKGVRIETGRAKPGMPWISYVPAHDIIVPWGTRGCDTARWIVHRVVRHLDEVKADPKYNNKKMLQPTMSMEDFTRSYSAPLKPFNKSFGLQMASSHRGGEYVELWEIHDRMTGMVKVIATGHDKFLRDEVDLTQVNGLPFTEVRLIPRVRSMWVTPDAYYLLPHQAELMDITSQATKQRRIRVAQFLYNESAIEEQEVEKIIQGTVGAGIRVKDGRPMSEVVHNIQHGNNLDLWMDAEHVRRDANDTIGFSRNQMGAYDTSSRRTASEAQIVDRAAGQRLGRRLMAVSRAGKEIVHKMNGLIQNFWKTDRVAQVLGQNGQEQWIRFQGKDLKGEFDYSVIFSNGQTDTVEARSMRAMQMYAALSQDPNVDPMALRKFLVTQLNDPAVTSIFAGQQNANVQMGMPSLQQQLGTDGANQGVPGEAMLSQGLQGG